MPELSNYVAFLGALLAYQLQIPLLALGLASIINASTIAHEILRWLGAAYLFYLGAVLLFRKVKENAAAEEPHTTPTAAFWQGVISNLIPRRSLSCWHYFLSSLTLREDQ